MFIVYVKAIVCKAFLGIIGKDRGESSRHADFARVCRHGAKKRAGLDNA